MVQRLHPYVNRRPTWRELEPHCSSDYAAYKPSHGASASDDEVILEARAKGAFRHIAIPGGKRLFDVGCGGGYFLRICPKLGATVQGVEPSSATAEQLGPKGSPCPTACSTVSRPTNGSTSSQPIRSWSTSLIL